MVSILVGLWIIGWQIMEFLDGSKMERGHRQDASSLLAIVCLSSCAGWMLMFQTWSFVLKSLFWFVALPIQAYEFFSKGLVAAPIAFIIALLVWAFCFCKFGFLRRIVFSMIYGFILSFVSIHVLQIDIDHTIKKKADQLGLMNVRHNSVLYSLHNPDVYHGRGHKNGVWYHWSYDKMDWEKTKI